MFPWFPQSSRGPSIETPDNVFFLLAFLALFFAGYEVFRYGLAMVSNIVYLGEDPGYFIVMSGTLNMLAWRQQQRAAVNDGTRSPKEIGAARMKIDTVVVVICVVLVGALLGSSAVIEVGDRLVTEPRVLPSTVFILTWVVSVAKMTFG